MSCKIDPIIEGKRASPVLGGVFPLPVSSCRARIEERQACYEQVVADAAFRPWWSYLRGLDPALQGVCWRKARIACPTIPMNPISYFCLHGVQVRIDAIQCE